eukprot:TRINITY_DN11877_c0_g1_i1.p1 TRINITY_DN11877_c0_g1~~TRINITY_DN11877_c0_g1_i1.p1  ORF type:complete len:590 (+),score=154.46 TRINITY_DN11877_c0_g1_i1:177-1772(+)
MKAGFANMNDLTVTQASQGLATYLVEEVEGAKEKGIIIGFDGRYNSKRFAELAAATFLHKGMKVFLFDGVIPTPLVAYGTTNKGCVAGLVITASHNPKEDNGYKVYAANGCQIVSPVDAHVTRRINENLVPWGVSTDTLYQNPGLTIVREDVISDYVRDMKAWNFHPETNSDDSVKITYTAMHGVGKVMAERIFKEFSLAPFIPVAEQVEPNPDFPTVAFPNPEEGQGALKLAIETAERNGSTLILANDPDADRLAMAEKKPDGKWHIFTGNEIGILVAHWTYTQYIAKHPEADKSKLFVANSTVSSKMLAAFAKKEGIAYGECLTGFKWIGTLCESKRKEGYTILMGFEEAIGYMIGGLPLDKDGISAAAAMGEMAHFLYHSGTTVLGRLEECYRTYGYFITNNRYFFCYDYAVQVQIFTEMRNGGKYTESVGPYKIKAIRDLTSPGYDSTTPDNKPILPVSSGQMITYYFENGAVATLRGSGTEPKLKYYVELSGENPETTRAELNDLVENIITHFLQPEKYPLVRPTD